MNTPLVTSHKKIHSLERRSKSHLISLFTHSIQWNAIATILYQSIYMIHHSCLYRILPAQEYGLIGGIFASIYLTVAFCNGGLNESLGAVFHDARTSRAFWVKLIVVPIISTLICTLCGLFGMFIIYRTVYSTCSTRILIAAGIICLCEAMRKPLLYIIQLLFKTRTYTFIEVGTLATYVAFVWCCFFLSYPLSAELLLIGFAFTLLMNTILLSSIVARVFFDIPQTNVSHVFPYTVHTLIMRRIGNWFTQLGKLFFSTNALISFIYFHNEHRMFAGNITFICTILSVILNINRKIFGMSSFAFFSQKTTDSTRPTQVHDITRVVQWALGIASIIVCVTTLWYASIDIPWYIVVFLFGFMYIEGWIAIYENLYYATNTFYTVGFLNVITVFNVYVITLFARAWTTLPVIMSIVLACRLCMFYLLHRLKKHK